MKALTGFYLRLFALIRSNFVAWLFIVLSVFVGVLRGSAAQGVAFFALCTAIRVCAIDPRDRRFAGRAGDYFDQCLPTLAEAPDASGTSLTRFGTHALTPDEFVADGISENLREVYGSMAAAIMRGYQPNMLDQVLFGRLRDYSMHLQEVKRGFQSIIQPFVTLPKEDVVNTGAFVITAGAASEDEDFEWTLTIENGSADFQNSDLPAIDTQFVVGDTLLMFFTADDGSSQVKHVEVVSSADATYGGTPAATVVVKAPYNQTQWDALSESEQALWQPDGGLVLFAGNSTSNYRSRCNQKGLYNARSMAHYWFQTTRKMFQWTDEYEKVNDAATMSEFFQAFLRIPLAEQIKILDQDHMRSLANDLFWGQPYAGQNVETWQTSGNIPVVYDLDGTTIMDVETRLKGYETQLDECGRVIDMLGAGLNIDTLKELLPIVARNRAGTGAARDQVWDIDVLVNPSVAALIKRVMAAVYKDVMGVQYTEQTAGGLQQNLTKNGVWANTYQIDEINLRLNVISGFWLEDMLSMAPAGHKNAATYAMFTDFTDLDWFVMQSKKRVVEYPPRNVPIEATKCLIDFNVRTIKLESMTHGLAVKRPSRHLIVKGFSNTTCPVYTPTICESYEG
jgi:hypothetical protein